MFLLGILWAAGASAQTTRVRGRVTDAADGKPLQFVSVVFPGTTTGITTDEQGIDHFHGHAKVGAEMANGILRRLKFDNDTRKRIVKLVEVHDDRQIPLNHRGVRRAIHRIGAELFPDYLKLRRADSMAQNPALLKEKLENIDET